MAVSGFWPPQIPKHIMEEFYTRRAAVGRQE